MTAVCWWRSLDRRPLRCAAATGCPRRDRGAGMAEHRARLATRTVVRVDHDHPVLEARPLLLVDAGVGDEDDQVAGVADVGHGAVEGDLAGSALDGVGHRPRAVADVDDVQLLAGDDVGEPHQLRVDATGPLVVQIRPRHRGAVDLRLHQATLHGLLHSGAPGPGFDRPAASPGAAQSGATAGGASKPRQSVSISRAECILPASTIRHPLAASRTSVKPRGSTTATYSGAIAGLRARRSRTSA